MTKSERGSAGGMVPELFEFFLGWYEGPGYSIKLKEGRLFFTKAAYGPTYGEGVEIPTSEKRWRAFWTYLRKHGCDVWRWEETYESPSPILDGTHWSLRMVLGDRRMTSSGINAFPGGETIGGYGLKSEFGVFVRAVRRLVGDGSIR